MAMRLLSSAVPDVGVTGASHPAQEPDAEGHQRRGARSRVSYLVFRLERRIRVQLDRSLDRHGITPTEYMALGELRLRDGLSSAELARVAFVTPQAMNLVVLELEKRGLIRRDPHPDHGRVRRAQLTPDGEQVLAACDRDVDAIEAVMLAETPARDRVLLSDLLQACAHRIPHDPY